jgi:ankyrin repeat protein
LWHRLHGAAKKGHREVADLLLTKGADVNAIQYDAYTPLHLGAAEGHKEVADLLLAKGADIDAKDNEDYTPLHLAVANEHGDIVEYLLTKKRPTLMQRTKTAGHLCIWRWPRDLRA